MAVTGDDAGTGYLSPNGCGVKVDKVQIVQIRSSYRLYVLTVERTGCVHAKAMVEYDIQTS